MLAATYTCAHAGVDSYLVRVEASLRTGLPKIVVVGMADTAVREGTERVRSAIRATVEKFPLGRGVVNLSPASRRKIGASFDLAIAMALLGAAGFCNRARLERCLFVGELGLDGSVRRVNGALPSARRASACGFRRIVVPEGNAVEAAIIEEVAVYGTDHLKATLDLVNADFSRPAVRVDLRRLFEQHEEASAVDFREVHGQASARRALEIAAAGHHHVLMIGPPGAGKTMLARRLPTILPPLNLAEAIETTSIHSIAGLSVAGGLRTRRPFRAPHHTTSGAGLIGGGRVPQPGEISLAHQGVLFLDELPEFSPAVLNQLREPLEDGRLTICRAAGRLTFPAQVMMVAAMNPCPCGYCGSAVRACQCPEAAILRYRSRISGPLLDRIDLHVHVPRLDYEEMRAPTPAESSRDIRRRVVAARKLARTVSPDEQTLLGDRDGMRLLARAVDRLGMSARAVNRVLRVARTIAYLDHRRRPLARDVAEALQFRPALEGRPSGDPSRRPFS